MSSPLPWPPPHTPIADILEALPVAVLVIDGEGRVRHLNAESVRLLGYSREFLQGRHFEVLLPEPVRAKHEDWRRGYMAAPSTRSMGASRELCCRHADGHLLPVEIGLNPVHTPAGDLVVATIVDISTRKELERRTLADKAELERVVHERTAALERSNREQAEAVRALERAREELERLTREDPLTGLANRREFDQRLSIEYERSVRHEHPLSVAMFDLDHFKAVNDRHGHALGDEVLRQVGRILSEHSRSADVVARYGGEEFVMALPDTSLLEARALCERIRREIAGYDWPALAPGLAVTISIGVVMRAAEESALDAVAAADQCLYEAKRGGRDCVRARSVGESD